MKASGRIRVTGPLATYLAGFAAKLTEQGYTELSLCNQLRLTAHFSKWLGVRGIEVPELTRKSVDRYLRVRRRTRTCWTSIHGLKPLLIYLGHAAIVDADRPVDSDLVSRYRATLIARGLSSTIQHKYVVTARAFLADRSPSSLSPADVTRFIRDAPSCDAGLLSSLRAILRFLFETGETSLQLVHAVPASPTWKLSALPKVLEPAQVRAILAGCDRRTSAGCRDYLIVLLMLRLGLRACEVAALTLDDIHWIDGEIEIRGKGAVGRLPLPNDVGEALVSYLRHGRRVTALRALFLTQAPVHAARSTSIVFRAGRILRRAGVSGGGHRLRHTAATSMLRRGASLSEIAQVLRHRYLATTAIYAKVDRDVLRDVAQQWPRSSSITKTARRSLALRWPGGRR